MKKHIYEIQYFNDEKYKYDVEFIDKGPYSNVICLKENEKLTAQLTNTGNNVLIQFSSGETMQLDYCQVERLRVLFHADDTVKPERSSKLNKYQKVLE